MEDPSALAALLALALDTLADVATATGWRRVARLLRLAAALVRTGSGVG